jgi:hypothetical protein
MSVSSRLTRYTWWVTGLIAVIGWLSPEFDRVRASDSRMFEFGFQHRIRFVDFDNIIDYTDAIDDNNQFFRFRTRLWGRLTLNNLEFKLQLGNEFRHYNHPDKDDTFDEIYFDQCYVKLNDIFGSRWSITAGRQNIMKGEGFVLFDGTPLDGSRSAYFNALVIKRAFKTSSVELIGITNPSKDQYLPRIGDKSKPLIEHDEEAVGTYYTHRLSSGLTLEACYLYKKEISPHDVSSPQFTPERSLHIAGGRASAPLGKSGQFTCELDGEYGEEDPDRTISAWAGYASWKHRFNSSMSPHVRLSACCLSGDDPDTKRDEGWTPPFSRWPKWSELYIYSLIREQGVACWSNMYFGNIEFVMSPVKPLKVRFSYYKLFAFHAPETRSDVFGTGTNRGDLFQIRTDISLAKGLTGHALYEFHLPGDYYSDDQSGHFLRFELIYQFAHKRFF